MDTFSTTGAAATDNATDNATDTVVESLSEQRARLRMRHSAALTTLMEERTDLRGVHALADHFDDAIRWSA